ncbi:MAG: sugar transferase [Patescibacteria group bacterium]
MKYKSIKKLIDIASALFLLIIFSPVMIFTAIAIKLTSPGPILADTPDRVGLNGKPFHLFKFRSMIVNAYYLLRTDPKFKKAFKEQQKGGNYKIKNDPRVTPVGRIIRKFSIDEMPQLVNVLRGEMSLVGPRPYYPDELKTQARKYPKTKKLVQETLSVKPGITGYWQVTGRSNVNFDKRIAIDAMYARNISFMLDLEIIMRTPWAMLSGKGAV